VHRWPEHWYRSVYHQRTSVRLVYSQQSHQTPRPWTVDTARAHSSSLVELRIKETIYLFIHTIPWYYLLSANKYMLNIKLNTKTYMSSGAFRGFAILFPCLRLIIIMSNICGSWTAGYGHAPSEKISQSSTPKAHLQTNTNTTLQLNKSVWCAWGKITFCCSYPTKPLVT